MSEEREEVNKAVEVMAKETTNSTSLLPKFSHEWTRLKFPSQREEFRGRLSSNGEAVLLWLEGRKSKCQWQTSVKEGCGPAGKQWF